MRARGTILLAVMVLGLGAYLWFVERDRPTTDERVETARRVVRLRAGDVDRITITRGPAKARETIRLQRDAQGHWQMTEPVAALADAGRAAGLATQVEFLDGDRTVGEPDLGSLGLDPPALVLELGAGQQSHTLRFGARDATGRRVYVEAGGVVHTADPGVIEAADKPADEFRDHRALPVEAFRVQRVALEWGGEGRLQVSRASGGWTLEAPGAGRADPQGVQQLIERITQLRADRFLAEAGGDDHDARIVLTLDDGAEQVLDLASGGPDHHRAWRPGAAGAMTVKSSDLHGLLPPDLGLLEDRQLFHLAADSVDRLVLGRGAQRVELRKQGETWTLQGSESTVAGHRVVERIRELAALRAERVAPLAGDDAHPLQAPAFAELHAGEKHERVDWVAVTGEGRGRKLRLTREGQTVQLICKPDAEALFGADEQDFLSGLAEPGDGGGHDHDHVHEREHAGETAATGESSERGPGQAEAQGH